MEAATTAEGRPLHSLQATSADFAVCIVDFGVGLASVLDPPALDAWGWRGALYWRGHHPVDSCCANLNETLRRQALRTESSPKATPGIVCWAYSIGNRHHKQTTCSST